MSEWERIAALQRIFERTDPDVVLGIGDDAAALEVDGTLIVSVDAQVEHVHFERAWLSFEDLGYRATMAALSDLAAMGARPLGVLGSWALTDDVTDEDCHRIAHGQAEACGALGTAVIGGNLSRGGELALHTTVLGQAELPLRRDGARVGDGVWVAGEVGFAGAGLRRLQRGVGEADPFVMAWRRPLARISEGLAAVGSATAAIDVSDGLAADVGHLARASAVAVVLDADALVVGPLGELSDGLDLVLHGGEDYALVVTSTSSIEGFRRIGTCEEGEGVWLARGDARERISLEGWDHFS